MRNAVRSLEPMTWYDRLLLFSPRTWFGVIDQMQQSPFTQFQMEPLVHSLMGIILPLLLLPLLQLDVRVGLLSPWTLAAVRDAMSPMQKIVQTGQFWKRGRKNPISIDCLRDRIEAGQCLHFGRYNIFLPEFHNNHNNTTTSPSTPIHALMFIPGALISHTAYSNVAAKLSDQGICVVTVSMEPCRMATKHLGAHEHRLKQIQQHVNRILLQRAQYSGGYFKPDTSNTTSNTNTITVVWSIGGHSLGSFAAMRVVAATKAQRRIQQKHDSDNHDNDNHHDGIIDNHHDLDYHSLIMWGSANFANTRTNLRQIPSCASSFPVLVLQGSNDALCTMDDASFADFHADFPQSSTTYKTIQGASHSWFASVEAGDPKFLGVSTITMEKHQEEAARITAAFLKSHVSRRNQ